MIDALDGYGVALSVTDDLEAHAAAVEGWGYSAIWLPGGQLETLEPLLRVLRATQRVAVVPGIVPLDVHGPAAIAELYAEAERIAPGRLVVGIGNQAGGLAALGRAVDEIDATVPRERRLLAALGPRKLGVARDRFGGAVTLLVNPGYTTWAREHLGAGATLAVDQLVVLDEDAESARGAAREVLGFLVTVPGYAAAFSRMGFTEADIRDLSDALVDAAVARGDVERVVARLREHEAAGADHVVVGPLGGPGELETLERLAPRLLRG
ncbi:TIGR03620 family F420-dependent LLM class oxidoreductase [Pseudonocardia zijingensis]|jgi:probable F420-dependent oxidoreductase|uniref:LLM class F420-dependent oxidoreductase n=1 Tax=Pseudonocardia zijingensis TaxID=153376 RepID=A0ABN1QD27_9PSEU